MVEYFGLAQDVPSGGINAEAKLIALASLPHLNVGFREGEPNDAAPGTGAGVPVLGDVGGHLDDLPLERACACHGGGCRGFGDDIERDGRLDCRELVNLECGAGFAV